MRNSLFQRLKVSNYIVEHITNIFLGCLIYNPVIAVLSVYHAVCLRTNIIPQNFYCSPVIPGVQHVIHGIKRVASDGPYKHVILLESIKLTSLGNNVLST